jgi:hypothetical protein
MKLRKISTTTAGNKAKPRCKTEYHVKVMDLVCSLVLLCSKADFAFQFLGSFAKLRKATIRFVMSVRLLVRMEQFGPHWTEFHEI